MCMRVCVCVHTRVHVCVCAHMCVHTQQFLRQAQVFFPWIWDCRSVSCCLLLAVHTHGLSLTPVEACLPTCLSTCTHSYTYYHTCVLPNPIPVLPVDVSV